MSVPAFVMKSFEPLTTHEPSRSSAVVRVAPASEPAPASVSPKAASFRPGGEVGKPLLLLLVAPEEEDRRRPERGVRGDGDRDGGVDPRQLLDRDRVRDGVASSAAVLLRDREAHQAELAELGDELVWKPPLEVELGRNGCDAVLCKRADRVANQLLLGREVEVHAARIVAAR